MKRLGVQPVSVTEYVAEIEVYGKSLVDTYIFVIKQIKFTHFFLQKQGLKYQIPGSINIL